MEQGFVLTEYFYNAFVSFEKAPQSFKESIGEMVYGMDVSAQLSRVKNITFNQKAPPMSFIARRASSGALTWRR